MLGTNSWEAAVSAIQGLVAKEQVISSMSIISGFTQDFEGGSMIFKSAAFNFFTPISAYAYMVFNLFSAPCFGAIGAMRRELGNTKKMLKAIAFQTALAWILASLVFNVGTFIVNL
jgi:ferrous iron transport protein B